MSVNAGSGVVQKIPKKCPKIFTNTFGWRSSISDGGCGTVVDVLETFRRHVEL